VRVLVAALSIFAFACSSQPPGQQLAKDAEPVGSWLATLQMTAEKWSDNSVPAHFARDTVKAAAKQLEKAAVTAEESPAPPALRDPLRRLIAQSQVATADFQRVVAAGDRRRAGPAAARFQALDDAFEQWKQSAETP
jgi:hypothetical protein